MLKVSYGPEDMLGHVDVGDIGRVVAEAFVNLGIFEGREIDLVAENLTIGDVAKILSEAAGVKVEVYFRSEKEDAGLRREWKEERCRVPGFGALVGYERVAGSVEKTGLEGMGIVLKGLRETF